MKLQNYVSMISAFKGTIMPFPSMDNDVQPSGRRIYIRHDVDQLVQPALDMAKLENEAGIKSVYYLLNTADYWKGLTTEPQYIQDLGHEVGWHNNSLSQFYFYDKGKDLRIIIQDALNEFKSRFGITVRGTASHGDSHCAELKYINYHVFNFGEGFPLKFSRRPDHPFFDLKEFGLDYEAYFLKRSLYLTDSGGTFNIDPAELAKKFNSMEDCTLQILCHPEHWQEL
jgi:hypothetical protein